MSDGLSQLAQRGRRTREIPPPRNPARTAPVQLAPVPEPGAAESATPELVAAVEPAKPATRATAPAPKAAAKAKAELQVVTVYLEQDDDDFLGTITHTARTSRPKTAISRSAVVWLALERLHDQMRAPSRSSTRLGLARVLRRPRPGCWPVGGRRRLAGLR